MINVEIGVTLALSSFTCMLNTVAENVSGMKKKAISVNSVMFSASAIPRLLSTSDIVVSNDLSELSVRRRTLRIRWSIALIVF